MCNITCAALRTIFQNRYNHENPLLTFAESPLRHHFFTYKKNEVIINQGDPVKYFYLLLNGKALVLNTISWSNTDIVDTLIPPHIMGLVEYLNNIPSYTGYVVAETSCTLMRISVEKYVKLIKEYPDLCYETLKVLGSITHSNMNRAETNSIFHPQDRLGHFLFLEALGKLPYKCPHTRKKLTDILYINLRTLHRYISTMEEEGYLALEQGKIIIRKQHFDKLNERYGSITL